MPDLLSFDAMCVMVIIICIAAFYVVINLDSDEFHTEE